jgi:NAD(P)-dependent dehydrogenase (short-subunit alcohol dehydrogenase family)
MLKRGHSVVICDIKDTSLPVKALKIRHPEGAIYGTQCDVSSSQDVKNLADFAKEKLG